MLNNPLMHPWFFLILLAFSSQLFAVELGKWTVSGLNNLLQSAQTIEDEGSKIAHISQQFLNTQYKPYTLIGSADKNEQLTVRLDGVDCMTYLESIEAMRRSHSFADFIKNLKAVRYKNGNVAFQNRNHFFLNWRDNNYPFIEDVTQKIADSAGHSVTKQLNEPRQKPLIPGIPVVETLVHYIPGYRINGKILNRLKNGDYIGLYTDRAGLDVTHVGIVIKKDKHTFFRHASAEPFVRKVVDSEFVDYFKHQRGFVVLRPLATVLNALMQ
ncbi:MAG: N-acetylmuramoyl-L-alanine amidase-like domain-containing protein [Methylococcales bacterium]